MKPLTPSLAIDTHIGEEEQNGKQEKEKKIPENIERVPNLATLDHLVASYDLHSGAKILPIKNHLDMLSTQFFTHVNMSHNHLCATF